MSGQLKLSLLLEANARAASAEVKAVTEDVQKLTAATARSGPAYRAANAALDDMGAALARAGDGAAALPQRLDFRGPLQQLSQVSQQAMATGDLISALAIQAPDIGMAFGPVGIALGVIAGLALPLAGDLLTVGDAAEEAGTGADAFGASLDAVRGYASTARQTVKELREDFGQFADEVLADAQTLLRFNISALASQAAGPAGLIKQEFKEVLEAQQAYLRELDQYAAARPNLPGPEPEWANQILTLRQRWVEAAEAAGMSTVEFTRVQGALNQLASSSGADLTVVLTRLTAVRDLLVGTFNGQLIDPSVQQTINDMSAQIDQLRAVLGTTQAASSEVAAALGDAAGAAGEASHRTDEAASAAIRLALAAGEITFGGAIDGSAQVLSNLSAAASFAAQLAQTNVNQPTGQSHLGFGLGTPEGGAIAGEGGYSFGGAGQGLIYTDPTRSELGFGRNVGDRPTVSRGTRPDRGGRGGRGGGGGGAGAASAEADAMDKLLERLRDEQALLRETDPVQKEMLRLREQMSGATADQRTEVEALVRSNLAEKDALDQVKERMEDLRQIGRDVIGGIVQDLRDGASAGEILGGVLDKIADKLLDMAVNGITDAIFGGGGSDGGGFLKDIFGAFAGVGGGETITGTTIPVPPTRPVGKMREPGGPAGASPAQIDVRVGVDDDGGLRAYVGRVSDAAARLRVSELEQKIPGKVKALNAQPRLTKVR